MSGVTPQHLDDIRQRVPLSRVIGQVVKLQKAGREYKGLCPFHQESTPSFTINEEKGFYHCFGCGAHGDVIRFVIDYQGKPFVEAVRDLAADGGIVLSAQPATPARELERKPGRERRVVESLEVARYIYSTSRPARGTIVEAWLACRGLDLHSPHVQAALDRLRFHPHCPISAWLVGQWPESVPHRHPAMVGVIERVTGSVGERERQRIGIHATFLRPDGRGKASLPPMADGKGRPTRKIFGHVGGGAVWLTEADCEDMAACPLVTGEGIETTLSAMDEQPGALRGAAALSLNNLQGGMLKGPHGEWPLWNPLPDPRTPPFLLSEPGAVIIAVDADMKPNIGPQGRGVRVQERKGARWVERAVSGLELSELCAALAAKAWRSVGAWPVRAVRPPVGMDFNDMRRARG